MINNKVCAIVVYYNGNIDLFAKNIIEIEKQVQQIVVVDNGSAISAQYAVEKIKNLKYIRLEKNYGIAKALNVGVTSIENLEIKYILTMDQDSTLDNGCVELLLHTINEESNIVSVGPNYNCSKMKNAYELKKVLISSGNLVLLDWYHKVGGYDDSLFIDDVDFDFSLKLWKEGGKCAIVRDAHMQHNLGDSTIGEFVFIKKRISEHSAQRYYYMYRNNKIISNRYFDAFPIFIIKKNIMAFVHYIEVLMFHSNKKEKIASIRQGKRDAKLYIRGNNLMNNKMDDNK